MNLIQNQQVNFCGPALTKNNPPVLLIVPVQIQGLSELGHDGPGQPGLPCLTWTGQEHHLPGKILKDGCVDFSFHNQ